MPHTRAVFSSNHHNHPWQMICANLLSLWLSLDAHVHLHRTERSSLKSPTTVPRPSSISPCRATCASVQPGVCWGSLTCGVWRRKGESTKRQPTRSAKLCNTLVTTVPTGSSKQRCHGGFISLKPHTSRSRCGRVAATGLAVALAILLECGHG